jgi:Bacteriocin-protection, YdeI or OmpD-Associated
MALTIAQKLRIKDHMKLMALNAPADFAARLQVLPPGVEISSRATDYQQIHWFVKNRAELAKHMEKVLGLLKPEIICWIYYPKGSSGIQTDLSRDHGWEGLLRRDGMQWLSLISLDDTWSAFGMRLNEAGDQAKKTKPKPQPADPFIDLASRKVHPPEDLAKAIAQSKKARTFFSGLSFTNQKEYVLWVVSAKRPETRTKRIAESVLRLEKAWKNPANR